MYICLFTRWHLVLVSSCSSSTGETVLNAAINVANELSYEFRSTSRACLWEWTGRTGLILFGSGLGEFGLIQYNGTSYTQIQTKSNRILNLPEVHGNRIPLHYKLRAYLTNLASTFCHHSFLLCKAGCGLLWALWAHHGGWHSQGHCHGLSHGHSDDHGEEHSGVGVASAIKGYGLTHSPLDS